ncbi:MAG: hypothetical protein EA408_06875 [Marinilabiliales bacterium]|nr:MAG: hypothetical protein EA408_06875 [Marinilabiliales bacterium]
MGPLRSRFIAHRGESNDAPENTLAAVNLAWERGVTAVEVDVHSTADGEICVFHDKKTTRTTGENLVIGETSLSRLQELDAGAWKGGAWRGEKIPALSQVLSTVPENGKLIIEIKSNAILPGKLQREIAGSGLRNDQVEIIAFDIKTLYSFRETMPDHRMLWLLDPLWFWLYLAGPSFLAKKIIRPGLCGINIGYSPLLTRRLVAGLKSAGLPVYVWTVNNYKTAAKLLDYGVDMIASDKAGLMIRKILK